MKKPIDINKMFRQLINESKKISKRKETLSQSKDRRIRRTKNNLLVVKHKINRDQERIIQGNLVRDHIKAEVQKQHCKSCQTITSIVEKLEVWSKSTIGNTTVWRMTSQILGSGMYEFHNDLPIRITIGKTFPARCASCLMADAKNRDSTANGGALRTKDINTNKDKDLSNKFYLQELIEQENYS